MLSLDAFFKKIGITARQTKFNKPPQTTYCVWFEDVETDGDDFNNSIVNRSITIEKYSYKPDDETEEKLEKALDESHIRWKKTARQWIETEQLYETIYDFELYEVNYGKN